jgi:alkylhydroperoxidase family enzyme
MVTRLTPVRSDEVADEKVRTLLASLEDSGRDVLMAHLFANATNVFRSYVTMSNALMNRSSLAPRLRELTILRLARRMDVGYEWWEHERIATENGVTSAEIDAIRDDTAEHVELGEQERFVLEATDEWVRAGGQLGDQTWSRGVELLGEAALVDLAFTWAWWGAWVPVLVRTFAIDIPGGEEGTGG